jgi:hypothetical protein
VKCDEGLDGHGLDVGKQVSLAAWPLYRLFYIPKIAIRQVVE